MTAAFGILASLSALAAMINFSEIRRDPKTTGWVFGIGLLLCVVFLVAAIRTGV